MRTNAWRLRSQIALLVLSVLVTAQAISLWLFVDERSLAIQAAIGTEAAGRAANVSRLIEKAPDTLHEQIIQAASSPLVRFELSSEPEVRNGQHHYGGAVEARIRALLDDSYSREIRVEVHDIEQSVLPVPNLSPEMAQMHAQMMQGTLSAVEMEISIAIAGGQWLNVGTRFERPPLQWSGTSLASFALTATLLLIAIFWFVLTRLTGPLDALTAAADRLGRGAADAPLRETGPREVRALTVSFNTMQERLTRFVADRTQMLAALAHDLRSPLTALRVQAELVDDEETRSAIATSVDEMTDMVEATLAYAKGVAAGEETVMTDLGKLVQRSIGSEPVEVISSESVALPMKPKAMIRAIRNLTHNAQRYGVNARVGWRKTDDGAEFWVDDDGPGIPEDAIEKVFAPYFRLETSRSQETGGHGLGLSIARSIALAHGGKLELFNRPEGGLKALMHLPSDGKSGEAIRRNGDIPVAATGRQA